MTGNEYQKSAMRTAGVLILTMQYSDYVQKPEKFQA